MHTVLVPLFPGSDLCRSRKLIEGVDTMTLGINFNLIPPYAVLCLLVRPHALWADPGF